MRKYPKRIRKMRASRVCGYGTQGQHRKAGQRAGKGKQLNGNQVRNHIT